MRGGEMHGNGSDEPAPEFYFEMDPDDLADAIVAVRRAFADGPPAVVASLLDRLERELQARSTK